MSDAFGRLIAEQALEVPAVVARFHAGGAGHYQGQAQVESGNLLARLLARLAGFPPAGQNVDFEIRVAPLGAGRGHLWHRRFGGSETRSRLCYDAVRGCAVEQFGPVKLFMKLRLHKEALAVEVVRAEILGLGLPGWLTPRSAAREFATPDGQFGFDISASLPLVGLLIRYRGSFALAEGDTSRVVS